MIQQAVLLAAGTGTRLMPLTESRPKCMVEVAGTPIVETLLAGLRELAVQEIVVVTGYQSAVLEEYLVERSPFRSEFSWSFIHNERYASTNNILSLQVAADAITGDFLLVESDVYIKPETLAPLASADRMLLAPYQASMDGTGVVLRETGEVEQMIIKAHLSHGDSLDALHKTVNFYSFSAATWETYRARLQAWVAAERLDQYYEAVLAELINEGAVKMRGVDVGLDGWAEVDDQADLAALEARIEQGW